MSWTVAVLGAGGFVGRHIVRVLAERGHRVVAVDRAGPGEWRILDIDQLTPGDVVADVAVHVAESSVLTGPDQHELNLDRANRVLACRFGRVIYGSSAVVYGDRTDEPRGEDAPTTGHSPYAAAKLAVEQRLLEQRCSVVRLTNLYGHGMSRGNVLSDIIGQLGSTGPLRVRDTSAVRDYLHVEDAARAFVQLVEQPLDGIVNLGTGVGTSVLELARVACAAAGTPDREIIATAPAGMRSALVLDAGRARRELGWEPSISLEQGIGRLVQEQSA